MSHHGVLHDIVCLIDIDLTWATWDQKDWKLATASCVSHAFLEVLMPQRSLVLNCKTSLYNKYASFSIVFN